MRTPSTRAILVSGVSEGISSPSSICWTRPRATWLRSASSACDSFLASRIRAIFPPTPSFAAMLSPSL